MTLGDNDKTTGLAALLSKELQALESRLGTRLDEAMEKATTSVIAEDVAGLESDLPTAATNLAALRAKRDDLKKKQAELEQETARVELSITALKEASTSTQERLLVLQAEEEALQKTNDGLEIKVQALDDNISRMARLSEELMTKITVRSEQMANMVGADNDD